MTFLVTISLPDELKSVWKRLPHKSAWVAKHLRVEGGWPEDTSHTSYGTALGMCNMYHKDGVCKTCMKNFDMIEYDIITEYERRRDIVQQKDWHIPRDWEEEE